MAIAKKTEMETTAGLSFGNILYSLLIHIHFSICEVAMLDTDVPIQLQFFFSFYSSIEKSPNIFWRRCGIWFNFKIGKKFTYLA